MVLKVKHLQGLFQLKVIQGQPRSFEVTRGQKADSLHFENFADTRSEFGTGNDVKNHGFWL